MKHTQASPPISSRQQGFTLVELSIVLVIIGLVVGSVLVGNDMVQAAKLNKLGAEFQEYEIAMTTFKGKYRFLPGDLPNAASYWSGTLNGDGDGSLSLWPPPAEGNQSWQAWKQMALVGLINGSYSGVNGPGSSWGDAVIGTNVPESRAFPNTGFTIHTPDDNAGGTNWFPGTGDSGTVFIWGLDATTLHTFQGVLSPDLTYRFDKKFDNGRPGSGKVMTYKSTSGYVSGCNTTDVVSTSVYSISNTTGKCNIVWKTGF